jgi:hypothetical protein
VTWWNKQYGPLPIPLWVAPSEARAAAIHAQWMRAWPEGRWLVTSDAGLQQNRLREWRWREEKQVSLEFGPARAAPSAPQLALARVRSNTS